MALKAFFCTLTVLGGVFFLSLPASAATNVIGNITTPTTWTPAGSPYLINGNISVSAALTIEPGTVVKMGTSSGFGTTATGSINADGAIFTSIFDDTHGGDTDPAGNAQAPNVAVNGWGGISNGGTLNIQNSQFLYGGRANRAMVEANAGSTTIVANTFQYANNGVIQNNGTAVLRNNTFTDIGQYGVWQKLGTITFGDNTFTNIATESYLLTTDTFVNEGGNSGARHINLQNMVFSTDKNLVADGLPYQFNATKINAGVTLTVEEGSVIKFWNTANNIINDGTLRVAGSKEKPVILTSYPDDTAGGDSNNNGVSTVPAAGQWGRIFNNASGTMDLSYTTIRYGGNTGFTDTGLIINSGTLTADHSTFSDSRTKLINAKAGSVAIEKSELARAEEALVSNGQSQVTLHHSDVIETEGYRILNTPSGTTVDASNNYWGKDTGPVVNGNVTTDPVVSTNVNVNPYLTASAICKVDCFSNVLFLPGIMGSRLYEMEGSDEDELWFSSLDARQERMEMNSDGSSKNSVYTKESTAGIVDTAYGALYTSFLADLASWKTEGVFTDYAAIPYDWRLSLDDIVMNGKVENGKLTYTTENNDLTQSYLYNQAKALQQTSKSEKVTLIGHSNGGLVIKAFIQKLKDTNDPLYHQIDKIIFVGVPQTGTPDSVASLLYGSKIGILWIGTSAQRARFLAQGMPTMYNLLPSEKLFNQLEAPIEFKGDNVPDEWISQYGNSINTYQEFEDFLTGGDGRSKPDYSDLLSPEALSENLFDQAQSVHDALDNWSPAPDTEVIQIAGWGLYTVAGLEVVDDKKCEFDSSQMVNNRPVCSVIPTVTLRDKFSLDGDETVLVKSAHDMAESSKVKKYWVDLLKHNSRFELNIDRIHKSILEVDNLRLFIGSLIRGESNQYNYIENFRPSISEDIEYTKYSIHSPLHLTLTDNEGNKVGWDKNLGQIVENIKGAQYSEIGEIKTIVIPKSTEHTVKLEAYASGSFSLDIAELSGEEVVTETKFEAIPALENTVVAVEPGGEDTSAVMKIDFTNDGTIETELNALPGEAVEYQNPEDPEEEDVTPPELHVTFNQDTKDVEWNATDNVDPHPTVEVTTDKALATDEAGNTTEIPFTKYREGNTRLKVQFENIVYNGVEEKVDKVTLTYDWQLKKNKLIDLDTDLRIKDKSRLRAEYRKVLKRTIIFEKDKRERIRAITTKPGFVSVTIRTNDKNIIWEY